jgi:hypothetical protein
MKFLLLFVAPFLITSCERHECNCSHFKTGTFTFEHKINGEKQITRFVRTPNLEIETYQGKTDTSGIKWVSDCEYILRKRNPKNNNEKKAVGVKIIRTKGKTYTFEFGLIGSEEKQTGTAIKL